jgi:hypothetical protein
VSEESSNEMSESESETGLVCGKAWPQGIHIY